MNRREGPIQIHPVRTPALFSFPVYPINALLHLFPIIALGMTSTDLHNGTLAEKALPHQSKELKLSLTPQAFFAITREKFLIANDANHTSLVLAELMVQLNHTCLDMYKKPITITPPDDLKIAWLRLRNRRGI